VEQMYASRCFRGSNRDLGCISCHDPHSLPPEKEKADYFRQRCLQCHHDKECSASTADRNKTRPADNCIQCHMPRFATADIAHTASTDHRIRKRPDKSLPETNSPSPGQMPLVNFFQDLLDPADGGPKRDLGVALLNYAAVNPQLGRSTAQTALRLLDGSLAMTPDDVTALEAQGKALWILDRRDQARAVYDQALAIAPKRETVLRSAGLLAFEMDEFDVAVAHFRTAQEVNPWDFANHFYLGQLYSKHEKWAEAIQELQAAIRLHPADSDSHRFLALCWVHSGDLEKARRQLERAIALMPTDANKLRTWLDDLIKEQKAKDKK
jgi:Flp pilus assembly protein TadD